MFYDSCFSGEITDFRKLGTGHKKAKVVVVDQNYRILFVVSVLQNRRLTTGKVRFDNNRNFDLHSKTVGKQKVSLFLWSEKLERRWLWQCEIEKIGHWLENARPGDVNVLAEFVAQESGLPQSPYHDPMFVSFAKQEIQRQLVELNLVQLQRLAAMLFLVAEKLAA